jgi:hypothetical protein
MNGRRRPFRHRLVITLALAASLASLDAHAARNSPSRFDPSGFYFGLGYRTDQIEGGFDGQSVLVGETMLALVPKLETGGGLEYSMSAFGTYGGCSVIYSEEKHDAAWLGAKGEAQLNDLAFDFRISLFPRLPVQPHVILGMGFKRLSVADAAADLFYERTDDAVYRGISWDAGLGASLSVTPRLLLDFSAVRCSTSFNTIAVGGKNSTITISDGLNGSGWSLRGELMWQAGRW